MVFRLYNHAGFKISVIKADQEFRPIFDSIKDDLDITKNYAMAKEQQDHQRKIQITLSGITLQEHTKGDDQGIGDGGNQEIELFSTTRRSITIL